MLRIAAALLLFAALSLTGAGRAETFVIDLTARAGDRTQTAHTTRAGLGDRPRARPVLELKAGQRVQVKWAVRYTEPKAPLKDVVIHCFAVREERAGQAAVPRLDRRVTAETAEDVDFSPGDKTEGTLSLRLDREGAYLLRVEAIGSAAGRDGSQYFAAMDVVVR